MDEYCFTKDDYAFHEIFKQCELAPDFYGLVTIVTDPITGKQKDRIIQVTPSENANDLEACVRKGLDFIRRYDGGCEESLSYPKEHCTHWIAHIEVGKDRIPHVIEMIRRIA